MEAAPLLLLIAGPADGPLLAAARVAAGAGAEVLMAGSIEATLQQLASDCVDAAIVDVTLDIPLLLARMPRHLAVPVFACGIDVAPALAVAAIRAGARDFLPLPAEPAMMAAALHAIATRHHGMVGNDDGFRLAVARATAFAASAAPLLIAGETGSGRETLARHVHAQGRSGRFILLDCAGVGADAGTGWLDSLYRGAARPDTLCLREPRFLSMPAQNRFAEHLRGGAGGPRLITVTSIDLTAATEAGRFSPFLLGQLGTLRVAVPPLRSRGGDIGLLAAHFAALHAEAEGLAAREIAPAALDRLLAHAWPGNVRELEDVMHRAVLLAQGQIIRADDLIGDDGEALGTTAAVAVASLVGTTVEAVERELILQTLHHCRGNRTSASTILGISVRTMRNKLKEFSEAGITVPAA